MDRQLLLRREAVDIGAAMRRIVALQAQEPVSPYVALWNRIADFDPVDLDDAFASGQMIKASLLRVTLHAVHRRDHPAVRAAMLPVLRASRLADRRFTSTALTTQDVDELIPDLVDLARRPITRTDVEAWLAKRSGAPVEPTVWWALRTYAPLQHAPTGGPWSFGRIPAFVAASDRAAMPDPDDALETLIRRYLEGFGPATIADIAQFTRHRRTTVRAAVAKMGDGLRRLTGPQSAALLDVPDGVLAHPDIPAPPRLLGMWDSVLFAYADRSRVIPDEYRALVIRRNGDALPTVLVDGHVAGVWLPSGGRVEVHAFHSLDDDVWAALNDEALRLSAMLERDAGVYGRYAHWFTKMPPTQVQTLPR